MFLFFHGFLCDTLKISRKTKLTTGEIYKLWRALLCLRERNLVTNSWYTGIYFDGLHYGRQGRDITWSNSTLFCTRLRNRCNHIVNVIDVNVVDVIEKLYKCTCLHITLNRLNVYNMLMQGLTYNASGKALITIANCNQHYEVF